MFCLHKALVKISASISPVVHVAVIVCCFVTFLTHPTFSTHDASEVNQLFELALPFWDNPCGVTSTFIEPMTDSKIFSIEQLSWNEQLSKSLQKIRHQLKIALELLIYKEYDHLYVEVKRGLHDRQYIPNWVPSKGDVEALIVIESFSRNEIARHLPALLADLQKFAVAFEQVYRDEYLSYEHSPKEGALRELLGTLRQVMCEVESGLYSLDLSYGPAIGRSIMSTFERDIPDYTHRMIRDNGILFKYRDYLTGWNKLITIKELLKH